jgi:hypothetical protein
MIQQSLRLTLNDEAADQAHRGILRTVAARLIVRPTTGGEGVGAQHRVEFRRQACLDGVSDQPFFQGLDVGLHARQVRVECGGTLERRQGCFIIA